MHSVSCNASRTTASIAQRTRFGIGDVYFLAAAYGLMEVVVDNIKRCSAKTVHLESGRKLNADVILKCIGMTPDVTVDKVVKAKFMRGLWINGDPRRVSCADADGIYAANFSATTIGPGDQRVQKAQVPRRQYAVRGAVDLFYWMLITGWARLSVENVWNL